MDERSQENWMLALGFRLRGYTCDWKRTFTLQPGSKTNNTCYLILFILEIEQAIVNQVDLEREETTGIVFKC